ncbi:MAG TPA: 3-oxoacyl-ACP reductase family protein [Jatrophihabitantaceae bacterium]|jgi:NAD(P)-dependent dehydrogenase (short-subunit alcohol dehydrogenase family)
MNDEAPSFSLEGNRALVTASGRGLGRAIAVALAQAGADVALGLRVSDSATATVAAIEALGRRAVPLQMDMASLSEIREAVALATRTFGGLDILVNNAGIARVCNAESVSVEDFDATLDINLKGTFFASQAAMTTMREQGYGRIINIGSQAGLVALPGESVYCMTKAAIAHLTKCLAVEWGQYGITVNCVAPTFIETPGTQAALGDPAFRADVIERIAALHRIGRPSDVTGAVVFLASPAASLITGSTITVDGGWTAR